MALATLLSAGCNVSLPDPGCRGGDLAGCLPAQESLVTQSQPNCPGTEKRICIVPLGQISPELVQELVSYYEKTYGLRIGILTPLALPQALVNEDRQQIDTNDLNQYVMSKLPASVTVDPGVRVIGLTPVDIYDSTSSWRFLFGRVWSVRFAYVSTSRMESITRKLDTGPLDLSLRRMLFRTVGLPPQSIDFSPEGARTFAADYFGVGGELDVARRLVTWDWAFDSEAKAGPDPEATRLRARKLMTKYIGIMYYGLPLSGDSKSPMYDHIRSIYDLDHMREGLPVPRNGV